MELYLSILKSKSGKYIFPGIRSFPILSTKKYGPESMGGRNSESTDSILISDDNLILVNGHIERHLHYDQVDGIREEILDKVKKDIFPIIIVDTFSFGMYLLILDDKDKEELKHKRGPIYRIQHRRYVSIYVDRTIFPRGIQDFGTIFKI